MAKIDGIYAREILDSRGLPTIECQVWLDTGQLVSSSAATGTSVGKYEAAELRDGDEMRMNGMGVLHAVNNINTIIAPQLVGQDPTQQTAIDQLLVNLDGTPNKSHLGANALIAVSQTILKAGATVYNMQLFDYVHQKYQLTDTPSIPNCIYSVINGGAHGADNLDLQEFQIIPASHIPFQISLSMAVTLYETLNKILISKKAIHSTGILGGFTPNLFSNTDAFEIMIEAIKASPFTFAQDLFFGADIAAETFFENSKYSLKDKQQPYSPSELLEYYRTLRTVYHAFYLEDPYQEDDWKSWQTITTELGPTSLIVGDSMFGTSLDRLIKAINDKVCNAVVIKPNAIGTISETVQFIQTTRKAGWQVVVSQRSGETNDDFIADFAVGIGANYCKFGPPQRGERVAKYNRLLQIDSYLQLRNQPQPVPPPTPATLTPA